MIFGQPLSRVRDMGVGYLENECQYVQFIATCIEMLSHVNKCLFSFWTHNLKPLPSGSIFGMAQMSIIPLSTDNAQLWFLHLDKGDAKRSANWNLEDESPKSCMRLVMSMHNKKIKCTPSFTLRRHLQPCMLLAHSNFFNSLFDHSEHSHRSIPIARQIPH